MSQWFWLLLIPTFIFLFIIAHAFIEWIDRRDYRKAEEETKLFISRLPPMPPRK